MKATLVVMAAGMGSRFGGLKQVQPITPDGKGILDFSVYDAKKAGFTKVVFIVREDILEDFKNLIGKRIEKQIDVEYVLQDTSILPEGRKKPFGTAHAILCCKGVVNEPFAIINADDYYGSHAFEDMFKHLSTAKRGEYAMTSYQLKNTLSKNGTVSRGVCKVVDGLLSTVTEYSNIDENGCLQKDGERIALDENTPVSMNLWGLTTDIFEHLQADFDAFLRTANLLKDEIYIPSVISKAVQEGKATVRVFETADKWYGITYREDLEELKTAVGKYIEEGLYEGI